jgi:hypothetical protein
MQVILNNFSQNFREWLWGWRLVKEDNSKARSTPADCMQHDFDDTSSTGIAANQK